VIVSLPVLISFMSIELLLGVFNSFSSSSIITNCSSSGFPVFENPGGGLFGDTTLLYGPK
jgi:hypothetical protein